MNEKRDYKRILIICILIAAIGIFSFLLIFSLFFKNNDFSDSLEQPTEENIDWHKTEASVQTEVEEYNPQNDIYNTPSSELAEANNLDAGAEPTTEEAVEATPEATPELSPDDPDYCAPDSYPIREDFHFSKVPKKLKKKVDFKKLGDQMQEILYGQCYHNYKEAVFDQMTEEDDYMELWFVVDAEPSQVVMQVKIYSWEEDYMVIPFY